MGFRVVMFIDSFMDDVTYVKDVEVCTYSIICYITGCICYGSENLDYDLCLMTMLDLLAQPHSSIP
jgi:predicted membrane channel-forming protein YqfA (hemolysin III family)